MLAGVKIYSMDNHYILSFGCIPVINLENILNFFVRDTILLSE